MMPVLPIAGNMENPLSEHAKSQRLSLPVVEDKKEYMIRWALNKGSITRWFLRSFSGQNTEDICPSHRLVKAMNLESSPKWIKGMALLCYHTIPRTNIHIGNREFNDTSEVWPKRPI
ncbi:hypothetical protein D5086_023937 [Populus alba]|uniref:Uncharacterized protein n=1 Tax=Populus alba TaxID=43335 RepID=A0ACC4B5S1_POPAL